METPNRLLTVLITLATLVLLGGCRTMAMSDLPDELDARVMTFEDVVRWGDLNKMYAFLKPDPEQTVEPQQGLDNVRVTGYELVEPLNQIDPMRWRQAAKIDYVLTDRQVVRQLVDFQIWESEDEGKTWHRTTPVPVFK
jgi:hypothetical protein